MLFHIPIKLPSLMNLRVNWRKMMRLKKDQRTATKLCMKDKPIPPGPLVVTITRIGPRRLDGDNLQGACKYVRDQIAAQVGPDDGSSFYTWVYKQRIGKYGVEVDIVSRVGLAPAD